MFVCLCNAISDTDLRRAAEQGHMTVDAAYGALGAKVRCGRCRPCAGEIIQEANPYSASDTMNVPSPTAPTGPQVSRLAAE